MRTTSDRFAWFASCIFVTSACTFGTSGEDGRATFSYHSPSCLLGCDVTQAMMVGTNESLFATASTIPPVSVVSSAPHVVSPGVVTRTCCENSQDGSSCTTSGPGDSCQASETPSLTIDVSALAAGTSTLTLVQSDGTTFDGVTLTVAAPASLAVTCATNTGSGPIPSVLAPFTSCTLGWTATAANGNPLIASAGVTFTSSDPNVVAFETPFQTGQETTVAASQGLLASSSLFAVGPGNAVVTAAAGPIVTSSTVQVPSQ